MIVVHIADFYDIIWRVHVIVDPYIFIALLSYFVVTWIKGMAYKRGWMK
jgi:hypothetical protein